MFPILGGRLLKEAFNDFYDGIITQVSNPWREAIEAERFVHQLVVAAEFPILGGRLLKDDGSEEIIYTA